MPAAAPLADRLSAALDHGHLTGLAGAYPWDARDRLLTLLAIYDLHTAPLEQLGDRVDFQGHPVVAELKSQLEGDWLRELERSWSEGAGLGELADSDAVVKGLRTLAVRDRLPAAYHWLAEDATWPELIDFLALEGGPDGGFDDLVALCQVGLSGSAKLALGKNYWDEMGQGDPNGVHTTMHDRLVEAVRMPHVPRHLLPVEALERAALGGLLSTNRRLQPELLGALGLIELQAGPRCRMVLRGFDRLHAPEAAYPFYLEHAEVDPVHGRDWVDDAIIPTVQAQPAWGPRIVKGAWWRATVNLRFFDAVHAQLLSTAPEVAAA